jgi:hypothetical protein
MVPYLDSARVLVARERADKVRHEQRLAMVNALRADEAAMVENGRTTAELDARIAANIRTEIRTVAQSAVVRMNERGDPDLAGTPLSQSAQDKLSDLIQANPKAMPSWRVRSAHAARMAERYRTLTAKGEAAIDNDGGDYHHLSVAAAYCDVFTCDAVVAGCVRSARIALGLPAPITERAFAPKDRAAAFVAGLMSQWP